MSVSPDTSVRRTHVVPTHLHTPDVLLTVAGISVSIRQFLLLLVGIALSYRSWLALAWVVGFPGGLTSDIVRIVIALVPCGACLALAFVRLAGRELDAWCLALGCYLLRPRILVWRSVRFHEPHGDGFLSLEEEECDDTSTV